tara:strand:+ start:16162 stop:18537 length:2376 start_codon:yes stop_codon:yes gene_type:complete
MTGIAGTFVDNCLHPYARHEMDIRTIDEGTELLQGTKVVLLMGLESLRFLELKGVSLNQMRGHPHERNGVVFIPTVHPQDTQDLRDYESGSDPSIVDAPEDSQNVQEEANSVHATKNKASTARRNYRFWFKQDVTKAFRILQSGLTQYECVYRIRPADFVFTEWASNQTGEDISCDIETNPETLRMTVISFATTTSEVWCIPITDHKGELCYDIDITAEIFKSICGLFSRNTIVLHNASYDLFVLAFMYRIPPPPYRQIKDTMLMHHRLFPDVEKSLGHCISLYTDKSYHKDEGMFFPKNSKQDQQLWVYNAKDVETTLLVYNELKKRTALTPGAEESGKQACEFIRTSLLMTLRGVRVDHGELIAKITELAARIGIAEYKILPILVGYYINPGSPQQVARYLYQDLKLKAPSKDLTGKKTLYRFQTRKYRASIQVILDTRRKRTEIGKLKSRLYGEGYTRITGAYNIAGTKSMRLSSTKLLGVWGTNMQNFNKKIKRFIIPDPGMELWQVDLAGVEAVIVSRLTRPGSNFRELFRVGIKPHVYVGFRLFYDHWCEVFDQDLSELRESEIKDLEKFDVWKDLVSVIKESDNDVPSRRWYYFAKQTCHSANYGIRAPTFAMNVLDKSEGEVVLEVRDATRFLSVYHSLFPEIRMDFQQGVAASLEYNMTLVNFFGFPRLFYGSSVNDAMLRDGYSWIPQSTGSGITAQVAGTELQAELDEGRSELEYCIMQNNHDSLMGQAPIGMGQAVCQRVTDAMNVELTSPFGEQFKLKSEAQVGRNWKEMIEVKVINR